MIYENITPLRLAAIEARVQQELGVSIGGNEGTATKNGVTISWVYDPSGQTLTVGDTRKPWYVPESKIAEELTVLVNGTGGAGGNSVMHGIARSCGKRRIGPLRFRSGPAFLRG